jgi:ubiquitin C-terminal hydrolase
MLIKKIPRLLILHLKRFKYSEQLQRLTKLSYRVSCPQEIRLDNTTSDCKEKEHLYELYAIVVHIGIGMAQGHYITFVRSANSWLCFDDDTVEVKTGTVFDFSR